MPNRNFQIKPVKFCLILLAIALVLDFISMSLWYFPTRFKFEVGAVYDLFFVDREQNFPTMYSALLLVLGAILIFVVAFIRRGQPKSFFPHWFGLGIGFSIMACDEYIMFHEKLSQPTDMILGDHHISMFWYSWVIPGMILVVILGLIYIRFIGHLPRRTRWLFLTAGFLYLFGVIILEMVGGYVIDVFGEFGKQYIITTTLEESFEFLGTIVFIYGLLDYLKQMVGSISFSFRNGALHSGNANESIQIEDQI